MVEFFFTLLNFAIVCGLTYYGFKRFAIPLLAQTLKQEKADEQSLHDDHRMLLIEQKHVEERLREQEVACTSFFNKIKQWRAAMDAHYAQQDAEAVHLQGEAEKKVYVQSMHHALKKAYEQVTPQVVAQLEHELTERFSDEKIAHDYLQELLRQLKK